MCYKTNLCALLATAPVELASLDTQEAFAHAWSKFCSMPLETAEKILTSFVFFPQMKNFIKMGTYTRLGQSRGGTIKYPTPEESHIISIS